MKNHGSLSLALAALLSGFRIVDGACSYISDDFTCTRENANAFMSASGCKCFSCNDVDGNGNYACSSPSMCNGYYSAVSGSSEESPSWSAKSYVCIGLAFIAVSLVVYAILYAISRSSPMRKYVVEKEEKPTDAVKESLLLKIYRLMYAKMFNSLLESDGKTTITWKQHWLSTSDLLDCVWCCSRVDPGRRGLVVRVSRLLCKLVITASMSFFFGSMEFDKQTCYSSVVLNICSSSTTSGSATITSSIDTFNAENSCSDLSVSVTSSFLTTPSVIASIVTFCVGKVGRYAQALGKPGSALDVAANAVWFAAVVASIPLSVLLSKGLLSGGAYTFKSEQLRMELILSVTVSSWLQDQIVDLFKPPFTYLAMRAALVFFPAPSDPKSQSQSVQPQLRALEPPHATKQAHEGEANGKATSISPPQPTE